MLAHIYIYIYVHTHELIYAFSIYVCMLCIELMYLRMIWRQFCDHDFWSYGGLGDPPDRMLNIFFGVKHFRSHLG